MSSRKLATAVIGAGPAGLLFCLVGRILEPDPRPWAIALYDKRTAYERTHRLRMDPAPYRRIQGDLRHALFDDFIAFLEAEQFRPSANQLERRLAGVVAELGIVRGRLTAGDGPGEAGLTEVRSRLAQDVGFGDDTLVTVVGADSVKSEVRLLVDADGSLQRERHQSVARLKLEGTALPARLGWVEQFKMAKLLGSVLDYRLNPNGYAEVDLFLAHDEHQRVGELGAVPAAPVPLDRATLEALGAPFFAAIVGHLVDHLGAVATASLQSTFRLEHQISPHVTFDAAGTTVFLVGDAAISLPFFRGMASLADNVHSLARAHRAVLDGAPLAIAARTYERRAAEVAQREIEVVRKRNRMVLAAREVVRISSVVPFPIQSWLLSVPDEQRPGSALTSDVLLNAVLAVIAGAIAVAAPLIGGYVAAPLGWLWLAALPVEAVGGYVFETARRLEERPNRLLSLVWQLQLAILLLAGIPLTVMSSLALGRPAQLYALVAWFVLGIAFVGGMLLAGRSHGEAAVAAGYTHDAS